MSTRTYQDAVRHLNTLQSNAATLEAIRASGGRDSDVAVREMVEYLRRIGYSTDDLNRLNVLHVTGTKGKGSTCAFADSILRHVKPDWKVGLYTSPHLVAVRERIRINGAPLSEEDFSKFFFEVWDRLDKNDAEEYPTASSKPMYFRFLTLVAYHAFLSLNVDATILEVGVGGTYDCTNMVPKPVVTGVSALGIDHTAVLGKTIKEIAWHKGGIYKPGVPALSVNQPEEGLEVLRQRASESQASEFVIVPMTPGLSSIKLGLSGSHQYENANLAIHLAREFLHARAAIESDAALPESYVEGLKNARWPGRCQTVQDPTYPSTTWFLDGAHTLESLECCMQWFVSPDGALRPYEESARPRRILVFNLTNGRSGTSFLGAMLSRAAEQFKLHGSDEKADKLFDRVMFCANVTYADGKFKGDLASNSLSKDDLAQLKTQNELASAWQELVPSFPKERVHVLPSIEHAVNVIRKEDGPVDVLVAGSLHLVGGAIEVAGLSNVAL